MVALAVLVPTGSAVAVLDGVGSCQDSRLNDFHSTWDNAAQDLKNADTKWVPQGLAYYPARDWFIVSSYDFEEPKKASILDIYRRTSSDHVRTSFDHAKRLRLPVGSIAAGGHVGGLAVGKGNLYVANTSAGVSRVHRISVATLESAADDTTVRVDASFRTEAASYAAFFNGNLFVGSFDNNRLYRYDIEASGSPPFDPVTLRYRVAASWSTPSVVQGLEVTADEFFFSRSSGRENMSAITVRDRSGQRADKSHNIRNMSEGIVFATMAYGVGETTGLYTLFESTSKKFGPEGDGGNPPTCRSHRVWFRTRVSL